MQDVIHFYRVKDLEKVNNLVQQLKNNEVNINRIVDEYNSKTLDLNVYISTFPNFFFAKRYEFYKKKFFTHFDHL